MRWGPADSVTYRDAGVCHLPKGKRDDSSRLTNSVVISFVGERVCHKELFVLCLVKFNHQNVDGGTDSHLAGLRYEFLYNRGLTPQWSHHLISVCNIGRE